MSTGTRKFFTAGLVLSALLIFSGCAKQYDFEPEAYKPSYKEDIERYAMQQREKVPTASLWADSGVRGTLFLDYKARQVGDLIVVNIVESSSASNSNSTQTSKSGSNNSSVTAALGLPLNLGMNNFLGTGGEFSPTIGTNTSESFAGNGSKSKSDTVSATIAARVIEILPSGNLVIEGNREIIVDQEKQIIKLTGVIRQKDISAENTVLSTSIADARISYSGKGIISDSNKKGWLGTVLGWVWPF